MIQIAALALETGIETRVTSAPPRRHHNLWSAGIKTPGLDGIEPPHHRIETMTRWDRNPAVIGIGTRRDRNPDLIGIDNRNPDVIGIDTPGLGIETRTS